jgi:hypothetical protein
MLSHAENNVVEIGEIINVIDLLFHDLEPASKKALFSYTHTLIRSTRVLDRIGLKWNEGD